MKHLRITIEADHEESQAGPIQAMLAEFTERIGHLGVHRR